MRIKKLYAVLFLALILVSSAAAYSSDNCNFFCRLINLITGSAVIDEYNESAILSVWHMDEGQGPNVGDGTGNDNALISGATWTSDSKYGSYALSFDGIDDYLYDGDYITVITSPGSFTAEGWFKLSSFPDGAASVIQDRYNADSLGSRGFMLNIRNDANLQRGVEFQVGDGSNIYTAQKGNVLELNTWYHIAGVYDKSSSTIKLFFDGALVDSKTGASFMPSLKNSWMGRGEQALNGNLDEIAVFNDALPDSKIAQHYSAICGDGITDSTEQCDYGQNNGVPCAPYYGGLCVYCSNSCINVTVQGPYCGDNTLQSPQEQCDPPTTCNPPYGGSCQYCNTNCSYQINQGGFCGDFIVNGQEQCDDGNIVSGDGCSSNCTIESILSGAVGYKEKALASLKSLYSNNHELKEGIKKLTESLGNRIAGGKKEIIWVDANHVACKKGEEVFDREKDAVAHLQKIKDLAISSQVNQAIADIVQADRMLSQTAINEAPAGRYRDKAVERFNKGELEARNTEKISKYKEAWKYANQKC